MYVGSKAMQPYQYADDDAINQDETFIRGGGGGTCRQQTVVLKDFDVPGSPNIHQDKWGSAFSNGCPIVMCDGSVQTIRYGFPGMSNLLFPDDGNVNIPD